MKCRYCKAEIPEGELYCKKCGREVQIVPDYNPLDEMLTAQIQLDDDNRETELEQYMNQNRRNNRSSVSRVTGKTGQTANRNTGRTRQSADWNTGRTRQSANRNTGRTGRDAARNTGRTTSRTTGNVSGRRSSGNTTGQMLSEKERRKRQSAKAARKKALRRKRRILLLIMAAIVVLAGVGFYALYQGSYNGIMRKAQKAEQSKDYTSAESYYKQAIAKNAQKADAYTGLADVYLAQDKTEEATSLFEDAVSKQTGNVDLYKACMDFYLKSDQNMEIPNLLDSVSDSMLDKLSDYVVNEPEFSLNDSTTYDDVQKLLLTTDADTIYYTTDGTDPNLSSTKYTSEGIQISEGETTVKAIAVNKKGVPSITSKKTYTVEFPVEDAPAVSPSTGQYDEAVQIEVKVPDGYTAYYTTDGTDPTTASTKYTGPIDMPKGETLFKVVLVNAKGRMSGITTRNYMYDNQ